MGYKFRGTVFIETIFAATAQKIKQQQHQHQGVIDVRFPDGVFMNHRFRRSYVPFILC